MIIVCCNLLYKLGQDFLNIEYSGQIDTFPVGLNNAFPVANETHNLAIEELRTTWTKI